MQTISGKKVSSFSFGTMQFGAKASEQDSAEMYDACRAAGLNFFDTANAYTDGHSERILGELVAKERDNIFVATKCAGTVVAKPEKIKAEFDESRKRLGMDSVDLLYLHRWDPDTPLEDTYAVVAEWVESGSVRYVGVSNYAAWQVMKGRQLAQSMGFDITFIQPMYNIVKRQVEVEILPMAISEGFSVCPYSPLGGGLLTGKYAGGTGGRLLDDPMYEQRYGPKWMHEAATALSQLAQEVGVSPATLAVSWVAQHKGVHGPIISARSAEQLAPSLDAINFEMSPDLYAKLCKLAPTPAPATDRLEESG